MPRAKKTETKTETKTTQDKCSIWDIEWTDHVLSLLSEDEKIQGNPTTDGLRRVFEKAMNCTIIESTSDVVQSPQPSNEKRATVIHSLSYYINDSSLDDALKIRTVNGAADVYWGNCDKVFRNHPVAVAETRAEGRSLRRALRLRKVLAAEEVVESTEDDIGADNVTKITNNQINFIDVIAKRLDIDVLAIIKNLGINQDNVKNILHEDALRVIRELSSYQQKVDDIPENIKGYVNNWSLL
jgi:hypothetical protein|tara:strand:+ start:16663 stop:17385 length:723 start_codon:yes stop_codon:yes gene_type:complete